MTKYLLIAIGILALACAFLWGGLEYERGEASRLRENQAALLDEVLLLYDGMPRGSMWLVVSHFLFSHLPTKVMYSYSFYNYFGLFVKKSGSFVM